jgi:hypothetical protein
MMIMQSKKPFALALAAVTIMVGALWITNRAAAPRVATIEDAQAEAKQGGYLLISTEKLRKRCQEGSENLLLVDTRQGWEYRTAHLKGALNSPMEPTWWSRCRREGQLEALLGPEKERMIAFY